MELFDRKIENFLIFSPKMFVLYLGKRNFLDLRFSRLNFLSFPALALKVFP